MTRVMIKEHPIPLILKGFGRYEVEIAGHVVRKDPEKNDACVAASILTQTLVQTLRDHEKDFVEYKDAIKDDAYAYMLICTDEHTDEFVRSLLVYIKTGFQMLEESFPGDFQITMM